MRDEDFDVFIEEFGEATTHIPATIADMERFNNDAIQAYTAWIHSYTDSMMNVNSFLVRDKATFATAPRNLDAILKVF